MPRKSDIEQQLCAALDALIDRTVLAREALASQRFDRFERCMKRRKAAFHNFSAIDALAKNAGVNVEQLPKIMVSLTRFSEADNALNEQMSTAASHIREQIVRINAGRSRISKYRSVQQVASGFAQSA